MSLLSKLLRKQKLIFTTAVLSSLFAAMITLYWNAQLSRIINSVVFGTMPSPVMVAAALCFMLLTGVANYAKVYISGYASEIMTHDLRMGYARHFALLPYAEAEKLNAGEQLSKLQNEIAGVSSYLNANLFQLFDDGVRFVSTFIWLLFISPSLTIGANLPVFFLVAYIFWSSKVIGIATGCAQQAKGQMNRHAETLLTLFPIIRLYDATLFIYSKYKNQVDEWEYQTIRSERLRARLMSLSAVLSSIPLLLTLLIGGRMVINGGFTVGTLYIFINLSGNVSGVLMNMPSHIAAARQFSANMNRLEDNTCL